MINFQYVVITSNVFTIFLNVQTFALNYDMNTRILLLIYLTKHLVSKKYFTFLFQYNVFTRNERKYLKN